MATRPWKEMKTDMQQRFVSFESIRVHKSVQAHALHGRKKTGDKCRNSALP